MNAVIVDRPLSEGEHQEVLQLLSDAVLYTFNPAVPSINNYKATVLQPSPVVKDEIDERVQQYLLAFPLQEVNGKPLVDYFTHHNFHLWYYHRFRIYYHIKDLFYTEQLLQEITEKHEQVSWYTVPSNGVNMIQVPAKVNMFMRSSTVRKSKAPLIKYFLAVGWRSFMELFRSPAKQPPHFILNNALHEQPLLNKHTLSPGKDNPFLGYMLEELDDSFAVVDELPVPGTVHAASSVSFWRLWHYPFKRKTIYSEGILVRGWLNGALKKEHRQIMEQFKEAYEVEVKDPITQVILAQLKQLHRSSGLYLLKYLAYRKYFSAGTFKTITAVGENNAFTKTILDAAKAEGMKAIGIQHGAMHKANMNYNFSPADMAYHPVPDLMLVWGEYWKQALLKFGHYPEQSIVTTGQIRSDVIQNLTRTATTTQGRFKLMFASQPFRDDRERIKAAKDVFEAVKDLPEVHLLLKPHPQEMEDEFFHNIACEVGCTNYTIERSDLYLLLSQCDALITCYSTVGAEVVYFRKPLLTLDYNKSDLQGYVAEGVAFLTSGAAEIRETVVNLQEGTAKINADAYEKFIHKYAHKVDGKTSERVIQSIKHATHEYE